MSAGGLSEHGLAALDTALAGHVAAGEVPGVVALVSRGEDTHVCVVGQGTLGDDGFALRRDSIFRIASVTKPVVGVAAMTLISDGAMALADPVERWLPELANRRVLRAVTADLTDTVPAERAITVEDVLSFRFGFGNVFAPGSLPVLAAEAELGLKTLGPPWPPCTLTPDQWLAALGSLPLIDQPGERWRYNTGATVAGILVSRVAGASLAEVLAKRVFEPLGMTDTGFYVPAAKLGRFTSMYAPPGYPAVPGLPAGNAGSFTLIDSPDGWYSAPPVLPDGSGGLVSTVDDLWAFTSALAGGGGVLAGESVALMLRDRTTARDKADNPWFFGDHGGWGLMMAVPAAGPDGAAAAAASNPDGTPRGYGWDGGSGTTWRTDPSTGLTGILLTQAMMTSPEPTPVCRDFWRAAYAAIAG